MSCNRITWKSTPVSQYPWQVQTGSTSSGTMAGISAPDVKPAGPFTLHQLTEFLHRARYFTVDYDITTTGSGYASSVTGMYKTASGIDLGSPGPEIADEIEQFECYLDDAFGGSTSGIGLTTGAALKFIRFFKGNANFPFPVYVDENSQYWLFCAMVIDDLSVVISSTDWVAPDVYITGTIVLESGNVDIPLAIESAPDNATGGTVTITATEWWPYAQTNCEPQWDTSLGVYIPDGTPIPAFNDPAHNQIIPLLF